jgi:hypothetical protein
MDVLSPIRNETARTEYRLPQTEGDVGTGMKRLNVQVGEVHQRTEANLSFLIRPHGSPGRRVEAGVPGSAASQPRLQARRKAFQSAEFPN